LAHHHLLYTRGIEREIDEEGNWLLRCGHALVTFNNVEVAKITAGVIFSGISPTAVADAVDADLTAQAASGRKQSRTESPHRGLPAGSTVHPFSGGTDAGLGFVPLSLSSTL